MRTTKDCIEILQKKFENLSRLLDAHTSDAEAEAVNPRIENAKVFLSELKDIMEILSFGDDDFWCDIVSKEIFYRIFDTSAFPRKDYDGIFGAIASCSQYPVNQRFLIVYIADFDDVINFKF